MFVFNKINIFSICILPGIAIEDTFNEILYELNYECYCLVQNNIISFRHNKKHVPQIKGVDC